MAHVFLGRNWWVRLALPLVVIAASLANVARGGGGPENVLVVANPLSLDSLTIANHYCHLRQIHSVNVFHLPWAGSRETIDIQTFRDAILQPILAEIGRRHLERQIDYIVYSSGFPYAVDFSGDVRSPLPKESGSAVGSITSLTYLYQRVQARDTSYAFSVDKPQSNFYYEQSTRGFRSVYHWTRQGQRTTALGESYYLAVMLGYTDGRGNAVDEVIDYLQRSALADCTQPRGTIYLMRMDKEIRSQTRHDVFPVVERALHQLGVGVEIESGVAPQRKGDVMGAVMGRSVVDWQQSGSTLLPGAICDNLTSFGGILKAGATQTPLTEFLKYGAAGSSGTVVEPFALQPKFPHPWLQVHYAQGATLAEAFYQSVASPYQLLIVGDPLCRPWARAPQVWVDEVQPGQIVQGTLVLNPRSPPHCSVRQYQLFIDGRYLRECQPGQVFEFDTLRLPDGYHEFRVVAVEDTPVESQGRLILPVRVDNRGSLIEWTIQPETVTPHQSARLYVKSPGAKTIYLFHERRPLGRVNREQGYFSVDPQSLGQGPVTLTAVAIDGKNNHKIFSAPIQLMVRDTGSLLSGTPEAGRTMDEAYMRMALAEAQQALAEDEVPVGAIVVHEDRVIAAAHNQREQLQDPTAHAEMIAITQAAASLQSWRLDGCRLYVTLEPCPMCAGAILLARIPHLVYGAADLKAGAVDSLFRMLHDGRLNHQTQVTGGILAEPCGQLLSRFFQRQRQLGKK